jgi:hypothetical protein
LWLNSKPTQIEIIDNRYIFVILEKAILKIDTETQVGSFFSYGDSEQLNYTYKEIQDWIKIFGKKYLLPLDEDLKEKYNISK